MVLLRGETYSLLNIEEFLISNHFTNTSLSVVNQGVKSSIRVHSLVLASCSPFLKGLLLMGLPHQDEEILLTGVSHEELQSLVQFLYTGFVDLPSREFYNSFLGLLQSLNIKLDQLRMEELLAPSTLLNSREDALSSEEDLWVLKDQGNVLTTLDDSEILYEFPIKLDESSGNNCHQQLLLPLELENIDPVPLLIDEVDESALHSSLSMSLTPPSPSMKRFPCLQCSKTFPSKYYLKFHLNSVHATSSSHPCPDCGKGFSGNYYLRQHMRRMHSEGGRSHTCSICSSSFGLKYDLIVHQRTHESVKRFHCQICSKTYSNSRALKEHSRTHTGERPYECKECKKCFALPKTLRVHYRQHSGERPYLCPSCGMTFVQNSTLKNHIKSYH